MNTVLPGLEIFILGIILDILGKYIAGVAVHFFGDGESRKQHLFIPALEIGHTIDRTTAFFVLVAGEILIGVSYISTNDSIGLSGEFERSALGVCIGFLLCWVSNRELIVWPAIDTGFRTGLL